MLKAVPVVLMILLAAACAPAAQPEPTAAPPTDVPATEVPATAVPPTEAPPTEVPPTEAPVTTPEAVEPTAEMMEAPAEAAPAWANIELVNASTGETFTLADYAGQPVYVHMMATWCSNCRASQSRLSSDVIPQVGGDAVFISLDVQSQLDQSTLAQYTQSNNFGWTFAVANTDLMNALAEQFGRTVANPPSTPHFVIYPDGSVSELQTGTASAAEVIALINGA